MYCYHYNGKETNKIAWSGILFSKHHLTNWMSISIVFVTDGSQSSTLRTVACLFFWHNESKHCKSLFTYYSTNQLFDVPLPSYITATLSAPYESVNLITAWICALFHDAKKNVSCKIGYCNETWLLLTTHNLLAWTLTLQ